MKRREVCTIAGTSVLVGLAGCLSDDGADNTDGLSFFSDYLSDESVNVSELDIVDHDVELVYTTERTTDQELADEIGTIAGGYVIARENGLDTDRLDATITDGESRLATWHVRSEWAQEFEQGELDAATFSTTVLDTVELVE